MSKSFSLAFPVIRLIHEHHCHPSSNRLVCFFQQQLADRVLTLTLPIFASFDILFHLSACCVKGIYASYRSFVHREPLSLTEAMRHLKIAWLFEKVLVGYAYVINPEWISEIFENNLKKFLRGLLLSGSPEIFGHPSKSGGIQLEDALKIFCETVEELPEEVKHPIAETLALMKEARLFRHAAALKLSFDPERFLRTLEDSFQKLESTTGSVLSKELRARKELLKTVILYLLFAPIFIPTSLIVLIIKKITHCFNDAKTNDKNDPDAFSVKMKQTLIVFLRQVLLFPLITIGGMITPFKTRSFFLTPLYKESERTDKKAMQSLFQKIQDLQTGKSVFVPMWTYAKDPLEGDSHAYYIVITKLANNYRYSILNRGWGMQHHASNEMKQINGDQSYDHVPFEEIKDHLKQLFSTNETEISKTIAQQSFPGRLKGLSPFQVILYGFPALWHRKDSSTITKFDSKHHRKPQKIGNCALASLLAAVSFHSAIQTGDMTNKSHYKEFIYSYKKWMFDRYNYLLDFDLQTKWSAELPSTVAQRQLDKMKRKLG